MPMHVNMQSSHKMGLPVAILPFLSLKLMANLPNALGAETSYAGRRENDRCLFLPVCINSQEVK